MGLVDRGLYPDGWAQPGDGSPCIQAPPCNQPHQKSYRSWNGVWPDASWEVTEPAIYYQAAYVKLLSKFVKGPATGPGPILAVVTGLEDSRPAPSDGALRVWPNPGQGRVQVGLPAGIPSAGQLTLLDARGQVCGQQVLAPATLTAELETAQLPAGLYLLRYQAAGRQLTHRLVLLR
jgi:endoglucanase